MVNVLTDNSGHIHIHDDRGQHIGDVCVGTGRYYVARTRWPYEKKYKVVSKHRTYNAAVMAMARTFAKNRNLKRADVLLCADYYDPIMICELVR